MEKTCGEKESLFLILDGNALAHRAFHALPPLTISRTGEAVNAVYGFTSTLLKVLDDFHPAFWAIAFDRPSPTFRHIKFSEYKAQRPKTPDELISQLERIRQVASAFHMPVFEIDGLEADDLLGTLSELAKKQGVETIIVTGDNDMLQLVCSSVSVLLAGKTSKETLLYNEAKVLRKLGVMPGQVIDLKALTGDPSDNIPGVPGIGPKTAAKLISQFGDLEQIYDHIDEITPARIQLLLREYQPQAARNKKLVAIVRDAPIKLDPEQCRASSYDREAVVKLFQELEFSKLLSRLPREIDRAMPTAAKKIAPATSYRTIGTKTELDELVARLETAQAFAIEVKASGDGDAPTGLAGIALSLKKGQVFYIPGQGDKLSLSLVLDTLKPVLENNKISKYAHDGKHIIKTLNSHGIELANLTFDSMIAAYLLGEKALSLQALAFNKLGIELPLYDKPNRKEKNPPAAETECLVEQACAVASVVQKLKSILTEELKQQGLLHLFSEVEMPLISILAAMEKNGILLDIALLRKLSLEMGEEIRELQQNIYESAGRQFNINSPQQLARILFEDLKLPSFRKTKTGYSTNAATLEALRGIHPIVELMLEYRQINKLKSTYVDALPGLINRNTARIHTNLNQAGTSTGRLSSSDPNLQNIPVRGKTGNKIRQAFIAPAGSLLLSADYSQIDLRALAHLSRDPALIAAFADDKDIHTMTAAKIFNVPANQVTSDMRRVAKTVNFGVIYGMSSYGLVQATNLTPGEANKFISLYFQKYPLVKEYLDQTKAQAHRLGYVQTLLGRRRSIPEINSPGRQIREAAERMAINAPVQGTSADIIKVAMINMHREMARSALTSKMLLQIHDEILFEVPLEEIEKMNSLIAKIMPQVVPLCVPLKVDTKQGKNWGEMAREDDAVI